MKIIHYFLGFPPYRTGGLTKFAFDLMKTQVIEGHEVIGIWPGKIQNYSLNPFFKEHGFIYGIKNVELINPQPVPLDEGIKEFDVFTKKCDSDVFKSFLKSLNPDIIHFHTLMGLYSEFIDATKELNIRTIMTSHDYFGLCPKVTLFRYGVCCDDDNMCRNCIQCNETALSLKRIQLLQSPIYRFAKNTYLVKKLRKNHRGHFYSELALPSMPNVNIEEVADKYQKLREYYVNMYKAIDFIHFNSTISEDIFRRYLKPQKSKVISITHSNISDNRNNGHLISEKLRIFCLAPAKPYKGWNVLKRACDEVYMENKDIELHIYSTVENPSEYMRVHEKGYSYSELPSIMRNADVVVSPSVCYETFGFTVIEALSFGVPVIVSDHMGSKDIVGENGIVVKTNSVNDLKDAINRIREYKVKGRVKLWNEFVQELYEVYEELI